MAVRLGIVIVHYNTPDDLGRCLASLRDQAPACDHETVVIDNASTAPGLEELQAEYPDVRWIRNTENAGYGRGCNQGMAMLAADYHLILNPDIVVLPGALDALLSFADQRPRAGLIGPQLLNEDGTVQESCRRFYTLGTLLLRRTFLGKLFPNSRTVQRHLMQDFDHAGPRPVDWVLGGCLLVRREALDRCGPMDERFFLYFEDVDWCYRMWQCGFEVVYAPDSRFVHRHRRSSASGTFNRSFWLHLTSLISFYEKWSLVVYAVKKWRRPLEVGLHWLLDMVLLAVALLGAYGVRRLLQPVFAEELLPLSWYGGWLGYAAILVTVAFLLMGRYRSPRQAATKAWGAHFKQMGLVALLLLAGSYLGREDVMSRAVLLIMLALYSGLTVWATGVVRRLHQRLERGYLALERTVLVGPRGSLTEWLDSSGDLRSLGVDVVGYVTADTAPVAGHPALGDGDVPWLGSPDELPALVDRFRVSQVAFWHPPESTSPAPRLLARLRRMRIRLRWILQEAWLLAAGARAESFGAAPSGVLDPDDGHILRRLAARPVEILIGLPLWLTANLTAVARGRMVKRNEAAAECVDVADDRDHNGQIDVFVRQDGRPLPLWWQPGLTSALLTGRIGLVGAPLGSVTERAGAAGDPATDLRVAAATRPGLTGTWASRPGPDGVPRRAWMEFFMNPGGLADPAGPGGVAASRDRGEEVEVP